jgi:hypothetical protein
MVLRRHRSRSVCILDWASERAQLAPHSDPSICLYCRQCAHDDAEIPFDWLLAEVTGRRGAVEFVLTDGTLSEL